jgi:hypothetical protein
MAENLEDEFGSLDDAGSQTTDSGGGGLRKQLEAALAQLKERDASIKELSDFKHSQTVGSIFKEMGLPEKIAKLYTGEADKDKALEWAREYADVFGIELPDPTGDAPATGAAPDADVRAAFESVSRATNQRGPTADAMSAAQALSTTTGRLDPAQVQAATLALFQQAGLKQGTTGRR